MLICSLLPTSSTKDFQVAYKDTYDCKCKNSGLYSLTINFMILSHKPLILYVSIAHIYSSIHRNFLQ